MVSSENINSQPRETLFGTDIANDPRVTMIAKYADNAGLTTEQVMAVINGTVDAGSLTLPDGRTFAQSELGINGQALFTSLARDGFELPEIINQLNETRQAAAQNPGLYDQLLNKTDRTTGQTVNIETEFLDDIRSHADAETEDEQSRRRNMFSSEELQKLSEQFPEMAQIFALISGIMEMVDKLTRDEPETEIAQSQELELDPLEQQQEEHQLAAEMIAAEEMQEEMAQDEYADIAFNPITQIRAAADQSFNNLTFGMFANDDVPAQDAALDTGFNGISFDGLAGISFDGDFTASLGNLSTPQVTMSQEFLAQQRENSAAIG